MTIFSINSGSFGDVTVTGVVSASTLKGDGSQITSVSYDNIASKPTLISSSTQVEALLPGGTLSSSVQVDITSTTNYTTFSSSLATVDTGQNSRLSAVESTTGSYATTGSNLFVGTQSFNDTTNTTSYLDGAIHVMGGMSVRKDVRVSGSVTINGLLTAVSMSTQYVTSSEYNVGVSRITLNDDDNVRFAGISIYDSGSSSPTSASIYWDSLQHRFIYENLSGSNYNSSIIMAGPKHTGTLGDEVGLTDFRVPVAHGSDHIDSRVASSSIRVDFPNRLTHVEAGLYVTGAISASDGINAGNGLFGTLQTAAQTNITSLGTLTSLTVSGASSIATGVVSQLVVFGANNTTDKYLTIKNSGGDLYLGSSGTSTYLWNVANTPLQFFTNNVERLRIDEIGDVGIGTTNPLAKLHVFHGAVGTGTVSSSSIALQYNSTTTYGRHFMDANGFYVIYAPSEGVSGGNISLWAASTIQFRTAGIVSDPAKMILDASGNLGLGVTPSAWATLKGIELPGGVSLMGIAGSYIGYLSANAYYDGAWKYKASSYATKYETNFDNTGKHAWFIAASGTANNTISWTQAMTLDASGNLGIGVTPSAKLDVGLSSATTYTSGATGNGLRLYNSSTTNNQYVGITFSGEPTAGNAGLATIYGITTSSGNMDLAFSTRASATLAEKMRITAGGNVGIGTTNPTERFDVVGGNAKIYNGSSTVRTYLNLQGGRQWYVISDASGGGSPTVASGFIIRDENAGSDRLVINSAGNVGIGTINPTEKFHVLGPMVVSDVSKAARAVKHYVISRTVGTTAGDTTNIGTFTFNNGAGLVELDIVSHVSGYSIASKYIIPIQFGNQEQGSGGPLLVLPISYTGDYETNRVDLDISISNNVSTLRLRRVNGSTNATHSIYIKMLGDDGTFAESSTTATGVSAPSTIFGATALTQRNTNVGIGITNPAQKLDINGRIRFTANTADTNYSADIYANYNSAHPFQIDVKNNGGTSEYFGVYADSGGANNRVVFPTGNIGIGTTSPQLNTNGGRFVTINGGTNASGWLELSTDSSIDGYGGAITFNNLKIAGSDKRIAQISGIRSDADNSGLLSFATWNAGAGEERMRIVKGGAVGINFSIPAGYGQLTVGWNATNPGGNTNNTVGVSIVPTADTTDAYYMIFFNATGGGIGSIRRVGTTAAVAYNTTSDRRLKENISPADATGTIIDNIQIVKHDWKTGGNIRYGVVAQDLVEVFPEAVSVGDAENIANPRNPWAVDYSKLVPMLIKEIQMLRARTTTLEAEVAALKNQ